MRHALCVFAEPDGSCGDGELCNTGSNGSCLLEWGLPRHKARGAVAGQILGYAMLNNASDVYVIIDDTAKSYMNTSILDGIETLHGFNDLG